MRAIQRLTITVKKILLNCLNCDLKVVKTLTVTDTLPIYLCKVLKILKKNGEGNKDTSVIVFVVALN
jgi:hypothetical protein